MPADVARAAALQPLLIEPPPVQVQGEQPAPVLLRPVVGLVDHQARVGVAAPEAVAARREGAAVGRGARFGPARAGIEVEMIGVLLDQAVAVRVRVIAVHAPEVRPGNRVPEMAYDGVDEERLADLVPVEAPGVGRALHHHLHDLPFRVIPPDAPGHQQALVRRSAGHPDVRRAGDAHPAPEPAVRPPAQAVGEGVPAARGRVEAVEQHLRFPIGHAIAVTVGNEEQLRRAQRKHAAATNLDAGENFPLVPEDGAFVEVAVVVRILKQHDAVVQVRRETGLLVGVGIILGHPEPAARVEGHRDRLLHLGLGGKQGHLETRRHFEGRHRLLRRHGDMVRRIRVVNLRKRAGAAGAGQQHGQAPQHEWHPQVNHGPISAAGGGESQRGNQRCTAKRGRKGAGVLGLQLQR